MRPWYENGAGPARVRGTGIRGSSGDPEPPRTNYLLGSWAANSGRVVGRPSIVS